MDATLHSPLLPKESDWLVCESAFRLVGVHEVQDFHPLIVLWSDPNLMAGKSQLRSISVGNIASGPHKPYIVRIVYFCCFPFCIQLLYEDFCRHLLLGVNVLFNDFQAF